MRNIFLATTRNRFGIIEYGKVLFLFLLMSACFASSLTADQVGQASLPEIILPDITKTSGDACPTKEELISKTRTLQMPFIANNGQVDEQVRFYAKTFGGTVFVTKEGEIVYSLPSGRDVPAGASQQDAGEHGGKGVRVCRGAEGQGGKVVSGWHGQAPLVRADAELVVANVYSPLLHTGNANCPPDRVFAKSLIAAYLPGLQKGTDKQSLSMPPADNPQSPIRGVALKETIIGAKIGGITGEQPAVTTVNYFTGNDKSKWKTNVPTYDMVNLGEVYKEIELSLKAYGDNVEKLFCVKPGASPEFIKVQLDGGKSLWINQEGQLEADTELGLVKFTKPIAYQEIEGKRVEVAVEYKIQESAVGDQGLGIDGMESRGAGEQGGRGELETQNSKRTYSFKVASYDKTKDLIIDPLLASTYLGGAGYDFGTSLALDTSGNVYVTGYTYSSDFPTTSGAYDTSYNGTGGGLYDYGGDVFVSKLDSGLTSLLASTFLGGSSEDWGDSLTLDTSGNVYVMGGTYSSNFPTTSGAYDTSSNGNYDVFVSKLDSGLTSLLVSTFLGGASSDYGLSLAVDTSGNVYVTGQTYSTNFPTTSGAYDTSYNGRGGHDWGGDGFVSKLDGGLTSLLASTYLGGSDGDSGSSLTLDISGNVYVTGVTYSTNFPTTSGAYDTSRNDVYYSDVFVSKLNSGLTSLLASTYLGGSDDEFGRSITLDTSGNVYVMGTDYSSNFPTTSGAYDTSYNGGGDVFVSKLDGNLSADISCTYSISPTSQSFGSSGGTGSVGVTASSSSCTWTAVSNAAWITVTSGGSGTGNGTVAYSVSANTGTSARTGTMTIAGETFTVIEDGIICGYSISPTSKSFGSSGGTGSVGVTASSSSCTWTAVSNAAWITVTSGGSGTGNGTVAYSVSANTGTSARTGTMTIAGQTFTVTQDGISCTYSISPTSKSFGASGGTGSVGVAASSSSCTWTAVSNAAWITVTSGGSGTGNGTVAYSVSANTGTTRTGTMTIAGQTFTVTQDDISCTYTISPTRKSFSYRGGTGSVVVKTSSGCSWTAVSNAAWITVTSGGSGTGNGTVAYSVSANTGSARTGTMTIAGKTFTVKQKKGKG